MTWRGDVEGRGVTRAELDAGLGGGRKQGGRRQAGQGLVRYAFAGFGFCARSSSLSFPSLPRLASALLHHVLCWSFFSDDPSLGTMIATSQQVFVVRTR